MSSRSQTGAPALAERAATRARRGAKTRQRRLKHGITTVVEGHSSGRRQGCVIGVAHAERTMPPTDTNPARAGRAALQWVAQAAAVTVVGRQPTPRSAVVATGSSLKSCPRGPRTIDGKESLYPSSRALRRVMAGRTG